MCVFARSGEQLARFHVSYHFALRSHVHEMNICVNGPVSLENILPSWL